MNILGSCFSGLPTKCDINRQARRLASWSCSKHTSEKSMNTPTSLLADEGTFDVLVPLPSVFFFCPSLYPVTDLQICQKRFALGP